MNVNQILVAQLKAMDADGLFNAAGSCGCGIDDLAPCEGCCMRCVPARREIATEAGEYHEIGEAVFIPIEKDGE